MKTVIVTRHPALVDAIKAKFQVGDNVKVIPHATSDDVKGAVVFGVLPLALACKARCVIQPILDIPADWRGKDLDANQMASCLKGWDAFVTMNAAQIKDRARDAYHGGYGGDLFGDTIPYDMFPLFD